MGCRASDHGLDYIMYRPAPLRRPTPPTRRRSTARPFRWRRPKATDHPAFVCLAKAYHRLGVVMQLHYNAMRNPNSRMFAAMGADTGFDCMNSLNYIPALYAFLDALERTGELPRTILYSLNPTEDAVLDTMLGAFQGSEGAR